MTYVQWFSHRSVNRPRGRPLPSAPNHDGAIPILMIHTSPTKHTALETWVTNEIADLAGTLPAPKAGLLLLDAQITDLETRCATRQHRTARKLGQITQILTR